jgi:zinc transporter ZupT
MLLTLSIVALLFGPLIYTIGRRNPVARQVLDGFIFITIAGIVTVNIIPEALANGGNLALVFLVLGIAFPVILERSFHSAFHAAHALVLALAALGLVIHSILDGIALLPSQKSDLAYAVILHRLPVGMAIWWSVRPNLGLAAAIAAFVMIGDGGNHYSRCAGHRTGRGPQHRLHTGFHLGFADSHCGVRYQPRP